LYQAGSGEDATAVDSYVGAVLATSPPRDPLEVVPAISGLQIQPRSMPARISSLFKILVCPLNNFYDWLKFCPTKNFLFLDSLSCI
jgi:hypothetical protein